MCGKGRDDRGGGVAEEVKYRPLIPLAKSSNAHSLSLSLSLSGANVVRNDSSAP